MGPYDVWSRGTSALHPPPLSLIRVIVAIVIALVTMSETVTVLVVPAALVIPSVVPQMDFPEDSLLGDLAHLHLYNDSFHPNSSYNDTDAFLPTGVKATIVVVYMIVCVVGLVGNCLVMYVIVR